ncbi:MAG: response regulator transcription factor [Acidobacteria bacterium]|nr:response regulator transcription factor [Acidobacteriota bacterium]MBI1984479.1 response regulator transcription factor [Acidobacteriota bacterium]
MAKASTSKIKIRILIADREGVFRLGLKKVLGLEDDLRVVAQADDVSQLPGLTEKFRPEVIFVQAEIVGEEPERLFSRVKQAYSRAKIIITASTLAEGEAVRFVKAGAAGVILKSVNPAMFVKSARKISENELWLPKGQFAELAKTTDHAGKNAVRPAETLTRREKSIISCLVQGLRNREIGKQLNITEQTVKNHLRSIYDKVGVSDRLELALYAIHQHLELSSTS